MSIAGTSTGEPTAAAAATKARIHDLGFQPYKGTRLPQARRFWVIARNVLSVAWRNKWGVRLPLSGTLITAMICAGVMVAFGSLTWVRGGQTILRADSIVYNMVKITNVLGFLVALVVGCALVADDLRTGSFQFYFSRPIRPRDYVAGKLLGLMLVIGVPMFAVPVGLSIFRLFLTDTLSEAWRISPIVWKSAAIGLLATGSLAFPAAAFGALLRKRTPAQGAFASYYILVANFLSPLSEAVRLDWLGLASTNADLDDVSRALFGLTPDPRRPPAWAAALAILTIGALAYAIVHRRVYRAETTGMGGG